MRLGVWAALLLGLSVGTAGAQNQAPAAQQGQMEGMNMDHGASHAKTTDTAAVPAGILSVSFAGKSADWTLTALAALPHKSVTVHNEHTKADETYSGVALMDLLVKLGVPDKPHGKDLALYLVAVGSDGYMAVYAVAEVNPDVHDATVIVADIENGKPLAADGPLKLVATGETRPARWVRNLVAVRVLAAE
jgi:hypothetical protein